MVGGRRKVVSSYLCSILEKEEKYIFLIEGGTEVGAMANQDPTKDAAKENGAGSGSNYWFYLVL